jgi:hypothetical protein
MLTVKKRATAKLKCQAKRSVNPSPAIIFPDYLNASLPNHLGRAIVVC